MKAPVRNSLSFLILIMTFCQQANGQEKIEQVSYFDSTFKRQADSLKDGLTRQGFIMVKKASITMESEFEMPVIVPLIEGNSYRFVFIGELSSTLYELRMFDQDEKQVVYQKQYGNGIESNIISYSYIPHFTEYHIIKPMQVNNKTKNIRGCIMMFKKIS